MENVQTDKKLLFVYNADSGVMNSIIDTGHKLISPETYQCNLCRLTFGTFAMRNEWKKVVDNLRIPVEFLHRSEFHSFYPERRDELPAAFIVEHGELRQLVNKSEINSCTTLEQLIDLIQTKLAGI